jgi:hypothetical protein
MKAGATVRILSRMTLAYVALAGQDVASGPSQQDTTFSAHIPTTWDEKPLATVDLPLADPRFSPVHVTADYYYRIPVRPVYKSYPIYGPGKAPAGYLEWLERQEPEIVFDPASLKTETDWIRAGELVFDAPISYVPFANAAPNDPAFYDIPGMRLATDGTMPYQRYVIRRKGTIEVGLDSCAQCHTRIMDDGTVMKGAQGNAPLGPIAAFNVARGTTTGPRDLTPLRRTQIINFGVPWMQPDPLPTINSLEEYVATRTAILPGLSIRQGTNPRYPAQIPDLIGVKGRQYLDHTGLVRHRSIGDLMRYAAINQDTQLLARYGDFIPAGQDFRTLPDPSTRSRYGDEQLYALALYIYSLKPPPNPNGLDAVAERGQTVFNRAGCTTCHTPPLYTSNKLTPVDGFTVPASHRNEYDILPTSVGTDPGLALRTRRGTGYYKVPSLKGVWYRGPFEHNGSVATLEDWFDPRRLRDDYVPTGFKGYGVTTRAVRGHRFGLDLSADDRRALIAFLKTL